MASWSYPNASDKNELAAELAMAYMKAYPQVVIKAISDKPAPSAKDFAMKFFEIQSEILEIVDNRFK